MKKFRLPSLWLVERTDHHARLSGDQDGQIVSNYADNAAEVGRPGASDTVKSQCSNFELSMLTSDLVRTPLASSASGTLWSPSTCSVQC